MKRVLYILLLCSFAGCNKEDAWDLFKTRGDQKEIFMDLPSFQSIKIYNNVEVILRQDTCNRAHLIGWSNLLPKVSIAVNADGELCIEDHNKHNFARSYDNKTTIYLSFKEPVSSLFFYGNRSLTNMDTLSLSSLLIIGEKAGGSIHLTLQTEWLTIGASGNVDITVCGESSTLALTYWGKAPFDFSQLMVNNAAIDHHGSNDVFINVRDIINASMFDYGNIYYKGNPSAVNVTRKGKGNVYPIP